MPEVSAESGLRVEYAPTEDYYTEVESLFSNAGTQLHAVILITVACVLGGAIGLERELAEKPVGIKTLMIVAGASAMLMILGLSLTEPSRVIQAIVTGIGFIGAGTIMRQRQGEHVEGLTSAATILLAASIGICVALQQFIVAVSITALTLAILIGVRHFENWIKRSRNHRKNKLERLSE